MGRRRGERDSRPDILLGHAIGFPDLKPDCFLSSHHQRTIDAVQSHPVEEPLPALLVELDRDRVDESELGMPAMTRSSQPSPLKSPLMMSLKSE